MKALATFGIDSHESLLRITLPRFRVYADLHGYDLMSCYVPISDRPAAWSKIPLLIQLLEEYESVLWLDADVLLVDYSSDISREVPPERIQGLVYHKLYGNKNYPVRIVPNTGVWLVKKEMIEWLKLIWSKEEYLDHAWWEQAALISLLGYSIENNVPHSQTNTDLGLKTHQLGSEWNYREDLLDKPSHVRVIHAIGSVEHKLGYLIKKLSEVCSSP
jgi:hypothetical protein